VSCGDQRDEPDSKLMLGFLKDNYAVATIMQSLASCTQSGCDAIQKEVASKLPANHEERFSYYWRGNGTTSISKNAGYKKLSTALSSSAYLELNAALDPYVSDSSTTCTLIDGTLATGAPCWAQDLYQYALMSPQQSHMARIMSHNPEPLNQIGTILDALDSVPRVPKVFRSNNYTSISITNISYGLALQEQMYVQQMSQIQMLNKFGNATRVADTMAGIYRIMWTQFEDCLQRGGDACNVNSTWGMSEKVWEESIEQYKDLKKDLGLTCRDDLSAGECVASIFTAGDFWTFLNAFTRSLCWRDGNMAAQYGKMITFPWWLRGEDLGQDFYRFMRTPEGKLKISKWTKLGRFVVPIIMFGQGIMGLIGQHGGADRWKNGENWEDVAFIASGFFHFVESLAGGRYISHIEEEFKVGDRLVKDYDAKVAKGVYPKDAVKELLPEAEDQRLQISWGFTKDTKGLMADGVELNRIASAEMAALDLTKANAQIAENLNIFNARDEASAFFESNFDTARFGSLRQTDSLVVQLTERSDSCISKISGFDRDEQMNIVNGWAKKDVSPTLMEASTKQNFAAEGKLVNDERADYHLEIFEDTAVDEAAAELQAIIEADVDNLKMIKFSNASPMIYKYAGKLALGIDVGLCVYQAYQSLKLALNDGDQRWWTAVADYTEATSNAALALALGLSGIAELTGTMEALAAMMGPAAIALVIVGVIADLVATLTRHDPKIAPVVLIDDHKDFVSSLEQPPQQWLEKVKNAQGK